MKDQRSLTPDAPVTPRHSVLLYDGVCGFCNRTVQFVLARDRSGHMRFAPLQGEFAAALFVRHPELRAVDSLILVETDDHQQERISVRSTAILRIAEYLGGGWQLARMFGVVPRALRDAAYDAFARSRYRLFGRYDSCPLPAPGVRARFLP
ncbi:MAG: thiol-disulfide oxidoreductase DCC family protein [Longimicrobiales bacterium]